MTDRMTAKEYLQSIGMIQAKKIKTARKRSELEVELAQQMKLAKLPKFEEEYRFLSDRRFRFDFAFPEHKLGVEVEGGCWTNGRHTRGSGFINDCKKMNLATLNGWRLLRFTADDIKSGEALSQIEKALEGC